MSELILSQKSRFKNDTLAEGYKEQVHRLSVKRTPVLKFSIIINSNMNYIYFSPLYLPLHYGDEL